MDVGYEKVDSSERNGSEGDVVFMLSRFLGKLANGTLPAFSVSCRTELV